MSTDGEQVELNPSVEKQLHADAATSPLLRSLLHGLQDLGLNLVTPSGERDGYINVRLSGDRGGRILCVDGGTGRSQFQGGSWTRVGASSDRFKHLPPGDKAVHPLETHNDLRSILDAAKTELTYRQQGGQASRPSDAA